jgi:hypothetical protein
MFWLELKGLAAARFGGLIAEPLGIKSQVVLETERPMAWDPRRS